MTSESSSRSSFSSPPARPARFARVRSLPIGDVLVRHSMRRRRKSKKPLRSVLDRKRDPAMDVGSGPGIAAPPPLCSSGRGGVRSIAPSKKPTPPFDLYARKRGKRPERRREKKTTFEFPGQAGATTRGSNRRNLIPPGGEEWGPPLRASRRHDSAAGWAPSPRARSRGGRGEGGRRKKKVWGASIREVFFPTL
ncbi:hypothetical protein NL676_033520 [Syzygium grande]|nr:hypothetical protein NL676_033520 [Syzygium grande]